MYRHLPLQIMATQPGVLIVRISLMFERPTDKHSPRQSVKYHTPDDALTLLKKGGLLS